MDIKLKKKGEVFENNSGQLIFICCICNASSLGLAEVENHLKSHVDHLIVDASTKAEINNESIIPPEGQTRSFQLGIHERQLKSQLNDIMNTAYEYSNEMWIEPVIKLELITDENECKNEMPNSLLTKNEPIMTSSSPHDSTLLNSFSTFDPCIPPDNFDNNFITTSNFKSRTITRKEKKFKCLVCIKMYTTSNALQAHEYRIHKKGMPPRSKTLYPQTNVKFFPKFHQYKCDICDRVCDSKGLVFSHIRNMHMNDGPHVCSICGGNYKNIRGLKDHMSRHNTTKLHTCVQCGRGFTTLRQLGKHKSIHTDIRKYICTECGKRYRTSGKLKEHEQKIHIKDPKYICDHPGCGRSFIIKYRLNIHKRSHTGERPLSCNVCQKTFAVPKCLSNHMKLHNPDKKYECKFCGMKFAQSCGRRGHEKQAHGAV